MLSYAQRPGAVRLSVLDKLREAVKEEGLLVLKCSGKLIEGEATVIRSAADLKKSGRLKNLVIVPGGQKQITAAMEARGLKPEFIDGRRVTSDDAERPVLRIAADELCKITSGIANDLSNKYGVGADFFPWKVFHGKPAGVGNRTGDITGVNCGDVARRLLCSKAVVLAPLGRDSFGGKLSFNADDAAVSVAIALEATQLILATDRDGIEIGDNAIRDITVSALAGLISDGTVTGGMVAKAEASIKAAKAGIPVRIINGNDPNALALALDGNCGTAVVR